MEDNDEIDSSDKIADEPSADSWDTRAYILDRSKSAARGYATMHKVFVQKPRSTVERGESRAGPLARFVKNGDLRGLQTYLLINAAITSGAGDDGWSATYPLPVWARAVGVTETVTSSAAAGSAMSKAFSRLVDRNLIERTHRGKDRAVRITLLRPDGSRDPFSRDDIKGNDRYLRLSTCFWDRDANWLGKLDLPALAMLLVMLHERPEGTELPSENMPAWYGWSADTAIRGLTTLEDLGVIDKRGHYRKDPGAPAGRTWVNRYQLVGDFALPATAPAAEDDE